MSRLRSCVTRPHDDESDRALKRRRKLAGRKRTICDDYVATAQLPVVLGFLQLLASDSAFLDGLFGLGDPEVLKQRGGVLGRRQRLYCLQLLTLPWIGHRVRIDTGDEIDDV